LWEKLALKWAAGDEDFQNLLKEFEDEEEGYEGYEGDEGDEDDEDDEDDELGKELGDADLGCARVGVWAAAGSPARSPAPAQVRASPKRALDEDQDQEVANLKLRLVNAQKRLDQLEKLSKQKTEDLTNIYTRVVCLSEILETQRSQQITTNAAPADASGKQLPTESSTIITWETSPSGQSMPIRHDIEKLASEMASASTDPAARIKVAKLMKLSKLDENAPISAPPVGKMNRSFYHACVKNQLDFDFGAIAKNTSLFKKLWTHIIEKKTWVLSKDKQAYSIDHGDLGSTVIAPLATGSPKSGNVIMLYHLGGTNHTISRSTGLTATMFSSTLSDERDKNTAPPFMTGRMDFGANIATPVATIPRSSSQSAFEGAFEDCAKSDDEDEDDEDDEDDEEEEEEENESNVRSEPMSCRIRLGDSPSANSDDDDNVSLNELFGN
jgi:hypothetical protein